MVNAGGPQNRHDPQPGALHDDRITYLSVGGTARTYQMGMPLAFGAFLEVRCISESE